MGNPILIKGRRDFYSRSEAADNSMSVGELRDYLSRWRDEEKIVLSFDNGYMFGTITENSFED